MIWYFGIENTILVLNKNKYAANFFQNVLKLLWHSSGDFTDKFFFLFLQK